MMKTFFSFAFLEKNSFDYYKLNTEESDKNIERKRTYFWETSIYHINTLQQVPIENPKSWEPMANTAYFSFKKKEKKDSF